MRDKINSCSNKLFSFFFSARPAQRAPPLSSSPSKKKKKKKNSPTAAAPSPALRPLSLPWPSPRSDRQPPRQTRARASSAGAFPL